MTFERWLSQGQIEAVRDAILSTVGYADAARRALIGPLPLSIRPLLPGGNAPELIGCMLDLGLLNTTNRLADGSVPLVTFLRSAISLAGGLVAMDPVRAALNDVEMRASGARPVPLAAAPEIKERILGGHNDMVTLGFMKRGLELAGSIAKLEVPRFDASVASIGPGGQPLKYLGTGWLIAPDRLITNHHVFSARNTGEPAASETDLRLQAEGSVARFDYDFDAAAGTAVTAERLLAWNAELDYAVVQLTVAGRSPLPIAKSGLTSVTPSTYEPVNIIQHPNGEPKKFGIRNNLVTGATATDLRYLTDTDGGSSGSPVLNDGWEVVALHRGATFAEGVNYQGRSTAYINLGTQIHAILAHITQYYPDAMRDAS